MCQVEVLKVQDRLNHIHCRLGGCESVSCRPSFETVVIVDGSVESVLVSGLGESRCKGYGKRGDNTKGELPSVLCPNANLTVDNHNYATRVKKKTQLVRRPDPMQVSSRHRPRSKENICGIFSRVEEDRGGRLVLEQSNPE